MIRDEHHRPSVVARRAATDVKIDREERQKIGGPAFDRDTTLPHGEPRKLDCAHEDAAQEMEREPGDTDVPRRPPGQRKVMIAPDAIGLSV
jgi:hypothetical protein